MPSKTSPTQKTVYIFSEMPHEKKSKSFKSPLDYSLRRLRQNLFSKCLAEARKKNLKINVLGAMQLHLKIAVGNSTTEKEIREFFLKKGGWIDEEKTEEEKNALEEQSLMSLEECFSGCKIETDNEEIPPKKVLEVCNDSPFFDKERVTCQDCRSNCEDCSKMICRDNRKSPIEQQCLPFCFVCQKQKCTYCFYALLNEEPIQKPGQLVFRNMKDRNIFGCFTCFSLIKKEWEEDEALCRNCLKFLLLKAHADRLCKMHEGVSDAKVFLENVRKSLVGFDGTTKIDLKWESRG